MHTWWHLARCQASDGFALLLHSHPFPPARFTEIHKVMFGIHRVCHFCCRPKFQRVQTHGQAKLLLQRVLCKRFGNTYIHTGLSEEQVWWFRTQLYIYIYIYIYICLQYATGKSIMSFQDLLRRCYRFSSYIQRVRLLSSFRSQQLTADLYNQACRPHAQRHRSYSDGRLSFCSASRFPQRSLHLEPSKGLFHTSLVQDP